MVYTCLPRAQISQLQRGFSSQVGLVEPGGACGRGELRFPHEALSPVKLGQEGVLLLPSGLDPTKLKDRQGLRDLVASASSPRLAWERVRPSTSQIIPTCHSGPGSPAL